MKQKQKLKRENKKLTDSQSKNVKGIKVLQDFIIQQRENLAWYKSESTILHKLQRELEGRLDALPKSEDQIKKVKLEIGKKIGLWSNVEEKSKRTMKQSSKSKQFTKGFIGLESTMPILKDEFRKSFMKEQGMRGDVFDVRQQIRDADEADLVDESFVINENYNR